MSTWPRAHEETAVVRVTVNGQDLRSVRIELLAMGRRPQLDRSLGQTTSPKEAGDILRRWLEAVAGAS
jgi:hypothetical protein